MRRADRAIIERAACDDILLSAEIITIAMAAGNVPYAVTMNYGYDGKTIWTHSARQGRKIDMLMANPEVAFVVVADKQIIPGATACTWTAAFTSVTGTAAARLITDPEEAHRGLKILMEHHNGPVDFDPAAVAACRVIAFDVLSITGKAAPTRHP